MAKRKNTPSPDPAVLATALSGHGTGGPSSRESGRHVPVLRGDIGMQIARDGTWFYHGSPITRKPLVKLFSTVLVRDSDDEFYLVTPAEKCRISVDDAPFVAVSLDTQGEGPTQSLTLHTNVGDQITVNDAHPIRVAFDPVTREPSPYLLVRDRLEALIARPVYYELAEIGCEEEIDGDQLYGVWSEGSFFPLGRLEDEFVDDA
tara:strand:+ start:17288 stop:17899 length:612 start_codon:yes stop_codon:yes gene_type:complete